MWGKNENVKLKNDLKEMEAGGSVTILREISYDEDEENKVDLDAVQNIVSDINYVNQ